MCLDARAAVTALKDRRPPGATLPRLNVAWDANSYALCLAELSAGVQMLVCTLGRPGRLPARHPSAPPLLRAGDFKDNPR
jgi:hypothetical protein